MKIRFFVLSLVILFLVTACGQTTTQPTAVIKAPDHAKVGQIITLDGSGSTVGSTPIVLYDWELGDGAISHAAEINYSYGVAGKYDISLTVTDEVGASHTTNHVIDVTKIEAGTPPTAVIEGPVSAQVGESVTFSAANTQVGSGPVSKFQWQAGDGSNSGDTTNATFTTSYAKPGSYTPIVTVIDNKGLSDSASMEIIIRE